MLFLVLTPSMVKGLLCLYYPENNNDDRFFLALPLNRSKAFQFSLMQSRLVQQRLKNTRESW